MQEWFGSHSSLWCDDNKKGLEYCQTEKWTGKEILLQCPRYPPRVAPLFGSP